MEKRIKLECGNTPIDQIKTLNLDNCKASEIQGLTDEYSSLESLSINNVGLTTLKGFPLLPNLKKLELSDNRISNGLNHLTCPKLERLNLSGNKIKDIDTLQPLTSLKELKFLDLFNNDVTSIESYKSQISEILPTLTLLDDEDEDDVSLEGDEDDDIDEDDDDDDDGEGRPYISKLNSVGGKYSSSQVQTSAAIDVSESDDYCDDEDDLEPNQEDAGLLAQLVNDDINEDDDDSEFDASENDDDDEDDDISFDENSSPVKDDDDVPPEKKSRNS